MMRDRLNAQDERILGIADRYVQSFERSKFYGGEPVDWRTFYQATSRQLLTFPRRVMRRLKGK